MSGLLYGRQIKLCFYNIRAADCRPYLVDMDSILLVADF